MRNRNNEIERDPDAEFDYKDFEVEHGEVIEAENPYDDYEIWDVEIREVAIKKVAVFAKDADTARELIESKLNSIDMNDIDEYHKTVEVMGNDGSSVADYTVPLEWYQEEDEEEE
jgi:hypothetical protein